MTTNIYNRAASAREYKKIAIAAIIRIAESTTRTRSQSPEIEKLHDNALARAKSANIPYVNESLRAEILDALIYGESPEYIAYLQSKLR